MRRLKIFFFVPNFFFSNVKGLATRILIDPCEEKKYSGQTQAHIYSQILGLGLELSLIHISEPTRPY